MERPADMVLDAFASKRLIGSLSASDPSLDERRAYEVAAEVHARRMERGEQPVGRKIGFTNRTTWPQFGIWEPIWGYVYDSTVSYARDGEARVAIDPFIQPRIEPEIQLHFAETPPVTRDEAELVACIDWIALGFEIVQCPYPDWRFSAADAIAACAIHGALVVGERVPVAGLDDCAAKLRGFTVELCRNDELELTGAAANVLDGPLLAFGHLTEVLASQAGAPPIREGEVVTTGTLTDVLPVKPGETWSVTALGIELPDLSLAIE
jgi:2-oxo-3-hexenedioate decarboxylase